MDHIAVSGLQILDSIATLVLISAGLAVVFGMMRVINLAHGEFIMLGGFSTVFATQAGIPLLVAMLVVAPLVVGLCGLLVERLIIRFLYGRPVDTMLATWGLSLFLIGVATTLFGNHVEGVAAPFGNITLGTYRLSLYEMFVTGLTAALVGVGAIVLRSTNLGLVARATMENPAMAATFGINPYQVYAATFTIGAALSGLAGGLLAPLSGVVPTMGAAYVAKAFITVITGGGAILTGTLGAATLLGGISAGVTIIATPVIGDAALLLAAIVLLRFLPRRFSGPSRTSS